LCGEEVELGYVVNHLLFSWQGQREPRKRAARGALTLFGVLGVLIAQVEDILEVVAALGWVGELVNELTEEKPLFVVGVRAWGST